MGSTSVKHGVTQHRDLQAQVAESVDALDLGSSGETCGGSSPPLRTSYIYRIDAEYTIICRFRKRIAGNYPRLRSKRRFGCRACFVRSGTSGPIV